MGTARHEGSPDHVEHERGSSETLTASATATVPRGSVAQSQSPVPVLIKAPGATITGAATAAVPDRSMPADSAPVDSGPADSVPAAPAATPAGPSAPAAVRPRSNSAADRFMRRILRVQLREATPANERAAHRGFQFAMVVSGVRCLVTYLLIPVLAPILSIANVFAAPIGILLCLIAAVSGISSLRRFWASDHRSRWMYTAFIGVVFLVLAVAVSFDIGRIVSAL